MNLKETWLYRSCAIVASSAFIFGSSSLTLAQETIESEDVEAAVAEVKGWELSRIGNINDKQALINAGMEVGTVSSELKRHFEQVGEKMVKKFIEESGERGKVVLSAYK